MWYNPLMAGGVLFKSNQKKTWVNESNNEILKDGNANKQTEINREKEFIKYFLQQLQKEQQLVYDRKQIETKKEIEALQSEIKTLKNVTEEVDHEVAQAAEANIFESNQYQVSFLQRLRQIIIELRKDIAEAGNWLECFNCKKRKKNLFWNTAMSKKGGTQYLMSNEHAAARSAN